MAMAAVRRAAAAAAAPWRGLWTGRVVLAHFNGVFYSPDQDALARMRPEDARAKLQPSAKLRLTDGMTAGQVADQILKLMAGPGRKAKGSLLMCAANALETPKDLPVLKNLLIRYRQKQVELSARVVYEIVKALCRINASDEPLALMEDPRQFGLIPSRRVLHALLVRYGSEARADPARFAHAIKVWELMHVTPFITANQHTRVLLLRACVLAKSPESLAFALRLLESPEAPQDLVREKRFLFWTCKLLQTLSVQGDTETHARVVKRLKEIKAMPDLTFPPLLDTLLQQ